MSEPIKMNLPTDADLGQYTEPETTHGRHVVFHVDLAKEHERTEAFRGWQAEEHRRRNPEESEL